MPDSIDLDEIEIDGEETDERDANYGDWIWREDSDPKDEPDPLWTDSSDPAESRSTSADGSEADGTTEHDRGGPADSDDDSATADATEDSSARRMPRVPGQAGPVGVPESAGGAGGGRSTRSNTTIAGGTPSTASSPEPERHDAAAEPSEMTLAFTYEAINRLADPRYAVTDARSWSDWIGIVGNVSTPVIRKFQRDQMIELDFFGGNEAGPAQRLADVTPDSMFYAERMVLVGTTGDKPIATEADWEFVPLQTAAENAGWEIEHPE